MIKLLTILYPEHDFVFLRYYQAVGLSGQGVLQQHEEAKGAHAVYCMMNVQWISRLCLLTLVCWQAVASDQPDQKPDLAESGRYETAEIILIQEDGSTSSKEASFPAQADPFESLPLAASLQVCSHSPAIGTVEQHVMQAGSM